jgi:nicotinamide mononucleotide transporter
MSFFDIDNIFFQVLGYPMSYLEFFGTVAGTLAIVLEAKANIWYWPVGLVNIILFFFLFYQVQLYPDMFLYVFFFITNLLGWWRWSHPEKMEEDRKHELRVSYMKPKQILIICFVGVAGTLIVGAFAGRIHEIFPGMFPKPSAFPFLDSFVAVMSVITTFLVIGKKIECWIFWILIDLIAMAMYFVKDIKLVAFEYLVFSVIAAFGLWNWIRQYRAYHQAPL